MRHFAKLIDLPVVPGRKIREWGRAGRQHTIIYADRQSAAAGQKIPPAPQRSDAAAFRTEKKKGFNLGKHPFSGNAARNPFLLLRFKGILPDSFADPVVDLLYGHGFQLFRRPAACHLPCDFPAAKAFSPSGRCKISTVKTVCHQRNACGLDQCTGPGLNGSGPPVPGRLSFCKDTDRFPGPDSPDCFPAGLHRAGGFTPGNRRKAAVELFPEKRPVPENMFTGNISQRMIRGRQGQKNRIQIGHVIADQDHRPLLRKPFRFQSESVSQNRSKDPAQHMPDSFLSPVGVHGLFLVCRIIQDAVINTFFILSHPDGIPLCGSRKKNSTSFPFGMAVLKRHSAAATASRTSFMSTVGSNRAATFPSRSIRNFVKFHLI